MQKRSEEVDHVRNGKWVPARFGVASHVYFYLLLDFNSRFEYSSNERRRLPNHELIEVAG
jgi:hypothetical protein